MAYSDLSMAELIKILTEMGVAPKGARLTLATREELIALMPRPVQGPALPRELQFQRVEQARRAAGVAKATAVKGKPFLPPKAITDPTEYLRATGEFPRGLSSRKATELARGVFTRKSDRLVTLMGQKRDILSLNADDLQKYLDNLLDHGPQHIQNTKPQWAAHLLQLRRDKSKKPLDIISGAEQAERAEQAAAQARLGPSKPAALADPPLSDTRGSRPFTGRQVPRQPAHTPRMLFHSQERFAWAQKGFRDKRLNPGLPPGDPQALGPPKPMHSLQAERLAKRGQHEAAFRTLQLHKLGSRDAITTAMELNARGLPRAAGYLQNASNALKREVVFDASGDWIPEGEIMFDRETGNRVKRVKGQAPNGGRPVVRVFLDEQGRIRIPTTQMAHDEAWVGKPGQRRRLRLTGKPGSFGPETNPYFAGLPQDRTGRTAPFQGKPVRVLPLGLREEGVGVQRQLPFMWKGLHEEVKIPAGQTVKPRGVDVAPGVNPELRASRESSPQSLLKSSESAAARRQKFGGGSVERGQSYDVKPKGRDARGAVKRLLRESRSTKSVNVDKKRLQMIMKGLKGLRGPLAGLALLAILGGLMVDE